MTESYREHPDWIEADRLAKIQRDERGGRHEKRGDKKRWVPGPYEPTAERESRARQIVRLRKAAARA